MTVNNLEAARANYYDTLGAAALAPLWTVLKSLVTPEPVTPMRPHAWDYDAVRPYLMRAGDLISAEEAERRVLILENPALPGGAAITRTLYAGLQLILPGEVAPCHRHSQSALRFVLEGEGATTAVDGERAVMRPFDLILTPGGRWHDHANHTDKPMIWLDGLDIPMVTAFDASFSEHIDGKQQHPPGLPSGDCQTRWGSGLRPVTSQVAAPPRAALFHYPYDRWRSALADMARNQQPDPWRATMMEFVDPVTAGPVMTTMSAFCHQLDAGFATRPVRQTDGLVVSCVEGHGLVVINGTELSLRPKTIVVIPAWAAYHFKAETSLVLFSFSDRAAQVGLHLWREENL